MTDLPPEVRQAVDSFAPDPRVNRKWHPYPIDSNYDPKRTLSATLHTIEMATGSSPTHIALYHSGEFKAQGTPKAGAFVSIRHDQCTDETVAVRIRIPGRSFAETKSVHHVNYIYQDGRIYWSGDWPFEEGPPIPGLPQAEST
jgi:hypothetical protein